MILLSTLRLTETTLYSLTDHILPVLWTANKGKWRRFKMARKAKTRQLRRISIKAAKI